MKKYLGIIGFLVGFIGIAIAVAYKYLYDIYLEALFEISLFTWVSTMTISNEMNKEKPKKWLISLVSILSVIAIAYVLFVYS